MEGLDSLEVECLPMDLPQEIVVDISKLANVDDLVAVADLQDTRGRYGADFARPRCGAHPCSPPRSPRKRSFRRSPTFRKIKVIAERRAEERRSQRQEGSQ